MLTPAPLVPALRRKGDALRRRVGDQRRRFYRADEHDARLARSPALPAERLSLRRLRTGCLPRAFRGRERGRGVCLPVRRAAAFGAAARRHNPLAYLSLRPVQPYRIASVPIQGGLA